MSKSARLAAPFSAVTTPMKTPKLPSLSASSPATGGPNTSATGTALFTSAVSSIVKPRDLKFYAQFFATPAEYMDRGEREMVLLLLVRDAVD